MEPGFVRFTYQLGKMMYLIIYATLCYSTITPMTLFFFRRISDKITMIAKAIVGIEIFFL